MSNYCLLLGTARELCLAELEWLLKPHGVTVSPVSSNFVKAGLTPELVTHLGQKAGGIVKIAQILSESAVDPAETIVSRLATEKKVTFSLIGKNDKVLSQTIKERLQAKGTSVRFTLVSDYTKTAYSLQPNYREFWLLPTPEGEILAEVVFCQDIRGWAKRDLDRPRSDPKSGMLPPKIARIMVNLSLENQSPAVVYDPFCGSGTILAEALYLGHSVIGSDQSQRAIADSQANLDWLKNLYGLSGFISLFVKDVAKVSSADLRFKPGSIVFEPYLGPPHLSPEKAADMARGLEKLYLGALKNLSKLQTRGQRLVCILPLIRFGERTKNTAHFIDRCENFGYTLQAGPLEYSRPQATIIRQIYILAKN